MASNNDLWRSPVFVGGGGGDLGVLGEGFGGEKHMLLCCWTYL